MFQRRRVVAAAVAALVALAAGAPTTRAQEDASTTAPAKVVKEAYFTAEADGAVPATLTREFPPGIVCLLVPQVCNDAARTITGPIDSAIPDPALPDHAGPQPVEPGTLPVGMLGGKPRYTSYLQIELPAIPKGSLVDRFDLILDETAVTYALESPAFRQAVLAGLVTYQQRTPEAFTTFVGDVADQTTPLAASRPTGIEVCAVVGEWAAGASQDATAQPERDCVFGANGVRDAATGTWTFDLSLLAQAWLDGDVPNNGLYLGPLGAENLAFGDPDTSTNFQISLGAAGAPEASRPRIRYSFSEGFGDDDMGVVEEITLDDTADLGLGGGDLGEPSAGLDLAGPLDPSFDAGLAPPAPVGDVTPPAPPRRIRLAGESRPETPWYLWLLLPLALAGALLYERSLAAGPERGPARSGALSRLMALRGAAHS